MDQPLVSIICLCYNQAPYVWEALESVWSQTYPAIELIVVDDASTDGSAHKIREMLQDKPGVQFINLQENVGNCRAFNMALKRTKGRYVIDLAADDVLLPERVAEGVKAMEEAGEEFAVNFTDAEYIDVQGRRLRGHYRRQPNGNLAEQVPQGRVYVDILERYFICTPSMMMRRSILDQLNGYDENLAYEDFDFWVRSARRWSYCFTDKILVKKRVVPGSWSAQQYDRKSLQLESTYQVCLKAKEQNKHPLENRALGQRLKYESRQAILSRNYKIAAKMLALKEEVYPRLGEDLLYQSILRMSRFLRP